MHENMVLTPQKPQNYLSLLSLLYIYKNLTPLYNVDNVIVKTSGFNLKR